MFVENYFKFKKIVLLIALALICNIFVSIKHNDKKILPSPVELSLISISIAITEIETKKNNYVGNQEVFLALKNNKSFIKYIECKKTQNNCILSNLSLIDAVKIAKQNANFKKIFYERENVGLIDFYKLSLIIFGYDISSFTLFYLTILCVSAIIFCLKFYNDEISLLIVLLFLFCHLLYIFILPTIDQELLVVYNRRSITILTIIPSLHLLISIFKKKILSNLEILFLLIQLFLIYLIIHFRSSANYQIIFLTICCLFSYLKERLNYKFYLNLRIPSIFIISFVILFSFGFYYKKTINLDPIYSIKRATHFFWHPIYIGLSSHPNSKDKYDIENDDSSSFKYIEKVSSELHQNKNWQAYYSNNDFDRLLKNKLISIMLTDTIFFVEAYLYKIKNLIEILFNEIIVKRFIYIIYATFFGIMICIFFRKIMNEINNYKYLGPSMIYLLLCTTIPSLFAVPRLTYLMDTIIVLFMIFILFSIKIINLIKTDYVDKRKCNVKSK